MIAGKKARNNLKEMAAARVVMEPFVTASIKNLHTTNMDKPWKPGQMVLANFFSNLWINLFFIRFLVLLIGGVIV
jgi:hypothetical protein